MPLNITSEQYNNLQGLSANAGDWCDGEVTFATQFGVLGSSQNKFTYNSVAGDYSLSIQNGSAADWGFIAGDTIVIKHYAYVSGTSFYQVSSKIVLYTTENKVYFDTPLTFIYNGTTYNHPNGRMFPTDGVTGNLRMYVNKQPNSVQFWFNLTPNGSQVLESVIDGELSRFELEQSSGIPIGVAQPMSALISKSGSYVKDINLTYVSAESEGWRQYKVTFKFLQWGLIKDGYAEPNYYANANCLAPVIRVKAFSQYGNPNGVSQSTSDNTQSNTGGFNENYNGGLSLYSATSIQWKDALGDNINALDYSGVSTFKAIVQAPNQINPTSTYRLGLVWRPIDGTYYQNKELTNLGENLLVLAPEHDFIADAVLDTTIYLGEANESGARWDLSDVKITLAGTELTIEGKITPNSQATSLFSTIADGGRLSTLWLSLGDIATDGTFNSKRVSLQLFNQDNIDAPTLGVQIPNVVDEILLDHAGNTITTPLPQTTTEDDVLYKSNFRLLDNIEYEGVKAEIQAYDTVTGESFSLENIFFNFTDVPFISGQFQPNFNVSRGFNLPPTTDRNHISLKRNAVIDIAGKYGLTLEYGYLSRWEYWLEQANANEDFFDITQYAFDGLNRNWQRFSNSGNWRVRIAYYTRLAGVDDFNYQEVGIRPYEDDVNVSTVWGIELLSDNSNPTNFVANELHELTATLTWSAGSYLNAWAEITIEDFEAGNRWVISSVLAQGGIASNPLQPIAGQTMLDLQLPAANVATLKTIVDTNAVSVNKVCVSARIYSEESTWQYLLGAGKDAVIAYSTARRLQESYTGALIRVRRSSDNTEQDIPYILLNDEYVLDEANLLTFVGTTASDNGYVVKRYNQSISAGSFDAVQTVMSAQPPIVIAGVVSKCTVSNRPAHLSDGVNHFHSIQDGGVVVTADVLGLSVFSDIDTGINKNRVGVGTGTTNAPSNMVWLIYSTPTLASSYNGQIGHFVNTNTVGGFVCITWGNNAIPSLISARLNGVLGATGSTTVNETLKFVNIDVHAYLYHKGYKCEDVIYADNRQQTEVWIENNVNGFYQMF